MMDIYPVLLHQWNHELIGILAAILCTITQLRFQQISGQPIVAKQRVIAVGLIMKVEAFTFLAAICVQ